MTPQGTNIGDWQPTSRVFRLNFVCGTAKFLDIRRDGDVKRIELDKPIVFSGGECGFADYAMEGNGLVSIAAEGISLLLGADVELNTATTGYFNVATATGGARVDWSQGGG